MSSYEALAGYYDELTEDVSYAKRADFIQRLMARSRVPVKTVLDLACGTGTMTALLTRRGYELVAVDGSADMLSEAVSKPSERPILWLCQDFGALDLYGTIDVAVCALDSLNHITDPELLRTAFQRVALFTGPGGLFWRLTSPQIRAFTTGKRPYGASI